MSEVESSVVRNVKGLLRRKAKNSDVSLDSDLYADLELDSLEVAELSVALEDEFGTDPYTHGLAPRTVGEVVDFYNQ